MVAALAAAIQADFALASMGVSAIAVGADLTDGGGYSGASVDDPGLIDCTSGPSPFVPSLASNSCPGTTATLSTGTFASYQWIHDGVPILGATGSTYQATLTGSYQVSVTDASGCPATSSPTLALVAFCTGSEASPAGAIYPLRIEPDAASSTGWYVYFQDLDATGGFNLYTGSIPGAFDHGGSPDNVCDLPLTDLGTGELRAELPMPPGDAIYFLVSPWSGGEEGVAHLSSSGFPADPAQSTCPP